MPGKSLELVRGGREGHPGLVGDHLRNLNIVTLDGIEASSNGSSAEGKAVEAGEGSLNTADRILNLLGVAAELLAEGQGGGILAMRASDFDDVVELGMKNVSSVVWRRVMDPARTDSLTHSLTHSLTSFALASSAACSTLSPGRVTSVITLADAMCIAVGNESLLDCPMLQ